MANRDGHEEVTLKDTVYSYSKSSDSFIGKPPFVFLLEAKALTRGSGSVQRTQERQRHADPPGLSLR